MVLARKDRNHGSHVSAGFRSRTLEAMACSAENFGPVP